MKIVVIGSVAAGTSVAAKARRNNEKNEITVYEKGKDISYSVCGMPFYLGGEISDLETLIPRDTNWFKKRFNVDIFVGIEVVSIDEVNQKLRLKNLTTGELFEDYYDKLVLATGATPRIIAPFNLNYQNMFTMHNMADTRAIDNYLKTNSCQNVVIFGTGYVGLEMMEQLKHRGLNVTLIQRSSQIMSNYDGEMAYRAELIILENGVNIIKNVTTKKIIEKDDIIHTIVLNDGTQIPTDLVILATGVVPQTSLVDHMNIAKGPSGALKVSADMATSIPNIYAVGDIAESFSVIDGSPLYRPMGSTANKMGRIAGHADYLNGTENIIKAIADKKTGKLLGVQIIGKDGVDKRIDVFATAMSFGATVSDLFHLDLAYQPLYATTKDPVLYTGMALDNALNGRRLLTPTKLYQLLQDGQKIQIIDVRSKKQYDQQHIDSAISMPLGDIRKRISELDKNILTVTYCNKGVTGNAAQNLLINLGFANVYNLSGGHKNYKMVVNYIKYSKIKH